MALSGGSTPKLLYQTLAQPPFSGPDAVGSGALGSGGMSGSCRLTTSEATSG